MSNDIIPASGVDNPEGNRVPLLSRGRRLAVGAAIAVVLLGSAACGTSASAGGQSTSGAGGSADSTNGSTSGTADDTGRDALMACLEQNGVPAPPDGGQGGPGGQGGGQGAGQGTPPSGEPGAGAGDPGGTGVPNNDQAPPGVDSAVWAKAQEACASVAQESGAAAPADVDSGS